ncbi:CoA pyrophosphatase [Vibrio sp. B1Z05]|uniref:CoA pyrophosphatase n=1 Tax=Vibrio sp. B1Z05 TaxID=2654980 RepID=UPI00128C6DEE|nr:CoA pyrophosphatase [Vibrio sp. B1Z05]MPW35675.1 CoA pyrophosphatase [Vibrio sp. B1Z05]
MTKAEFLQQFNFTTPSDYDAFSLQRLAHFSQDVLRPAAVLIGLVERKNGLHVVFTKRAAHLKHHPGQVSFPGGKYESSDKLLLNTAVRETTEEVGIPSHMIEIIGTLPSLPTISQFSVTPYLAWIDASYQPKIDANEVAEVFEVPADFLFSPINLVNFHFQLKTVTHKVFAMPYQKHFIWGVTAQIIDAMQRQLAPFGGINSA